MMKNDISSRAKVPAFRSFQDKQNLCQWRYSQLGECRHLNTPEDYPLIFRDEADFKAGMTLMAICAILCPGIKIFTFELMSNHIHIIYAGDEQIGKRLFTLFRKYLSRYLTSRYGCGNLRDWECKSRPINSLEDFRNAVAYDNRNGFLVNPDETPFSYPWGANRYFFNPEAKLRYREQARPLSFKLKREVTHSHVADNLQGLCEVDGYASPLSFCAIDEAEACYRDAGHYFYKVSRDMESKKEIAKELGERVFYTDDELYAILVMHGHERYQCDNPTLLLPEQKLELAKLMKYEYHAGEKQIRRMLRLDPSIISALFGRP